MVIMPFKAQTTKNKRKKIDNMLRNYIYSTLMNFKKKEKMNIAYKKMKLI